MNRRLRTTLLCALCWLGLSPAARAAETHGTPVTLAELSVSVQKTIQNQIGSARLGTILRSVEHCETNYDVEFTAKDKPRSFSVSAEGELLSEQVFLAELPRRLQKAIRTRVGDGSLDEITKATEEGEVSYTVEMTKAGRIRHFSLAGDGQLLDWQVFREELPAAVAQALQKALTAGKCGDMYKSLDEGQVTYDVEILLGDQSRDVSFDERGTMVYQEEPVAVSDAPPAVQRTLQAQLKDARLIRLSKAVEETEVTYEAELVRAQKRQSLSIKPDGQLLPAEAN